MAVKEVLERRFTDSGYDYLYPHTPFEVVTPSEPVTNTAGVYNVPTKVPTAHYNRPMLVAFKAPSACITAQKFSVNGGTTVTIVPGYRDGLIAGDIASGDPVVIFYDPVNFYATLVSAGGQSPHTSYFANNFNSTAFPANSQPGDLRWETMVVSDGTYYAEAHDLYGSTDTIFYPVTPRQVYYSPTTPLTSGAYRVTLPEYPLSQRTAKGKVGLIFIAKLQSGCAGSDSIFVDGVSYGVIRIGTGQAGGFWRGLFAGEIKAGQTCTFQINEDGFVYLLFIDGKAATGAGSTITLSKASAPPLNPLAKDMWLEIVKVVVP